MVLPDLKQANFCSTLMGAIKGAADFFALDYSPAMLFGLSGHIFLTNIHEALCPSGPYAWNKQGFVRLLAPLGIDIFAEHWFDPRSSRQERELMEQRIVDTIHDGGLCILESLEYQLLNGYDDRNLHFALPWGGVDSERPSLTRGTWDECLAHGFVGFKLLRKSAVAGPDNLQVVARLADAVQYGLALYRDPQPYLAGDSYRIGPAAFDSWIRAVQAGHGSEHGHWWNAMVWAENRRMAAEFFAEMAAACETPVAEGTAATPGSPGAGGTARSEASSTTGTTAADLCRRLSELYATTAGDIDHAKDRGMAGDDQAALLRRCLASEPQIEAFLAQLAQALTHRHPYRRSATPRSA